jgi:hypothetical protein
MAISVTLNPITSGYNVSKINANFTAISSALQDALSRTGVTPNTMSADIDMNNNDLINVGSIDADSYTLGGDTFDLTIANAAALEATVQGYAADAAASAAAAATWNPASYYTKVQSDANYYAKAVTYTKTEADTLLGGKAATTTTISTTGLLTGGGSLAANRTFDVPKSSNAQALAGVDDTTAMTPLRVQDKINTIVSLSVSSAVATTSGLLVDLTGIASTAKRIVLSFNGVSFNNTASGMIQLGSTTVQTTGYKSTSTRSFYSGGAGLGTNAYTTGIGIQSVAAAAELTGHVVLTKHTGNTWTVSYTLSDTGATADPNISTFSGSGVVTLSGVLDRIRITTAAGTASFDAGSVTVFTE